MADRRRHAAVDPQLEAAEILDALHKLPIETHDRLLAELAQAAAHVTEDPSHVEPLMLFLRRLAVSVRVRQDPMFEKLLDEAKAEQGPPQRVTAKELIAAIRE